MYIPRLLSYRRFICTSIYLNIDDFRVNPIASSMLNLVVDSRLSDRGRGNASEPLAIFRNLVELVLSDMVFIAK